MKFPRKMIDFNCIFLMWENPNSSMKSCGNAESRCVLLDNSHPTIELIGSKTLTIFLAGPVEILSLMIHVSDVLNAITCSRETGLR